MASYPKLPDPPAGDPEAETAILYGCRLLTFLLQTGVYVTATDEQLELAEHASSLAVTAPGILPIAVDRLSDVRHEIAATLRRRTAEAKLTQDPPAAGCRPIGEAIGGRTDGYNGDGGPRVPRRPYPLAPAPGDRIPVPAIDF